jgi:acetyltransferase-like isoleucine patch superfamily enzyme
MAGRAVGWVKAVRHQAVEPLLSAAARRLRNRLLRTYAVHGPAERLRLAPTAVVYDALFNLSSGTITVADWAMFGHDVMILTGTHDVLELGRDRQESSPPSGRDVYIGEGAWLASRVTVLGPCTIGDHAVVAAGSLVLDDVKPYTVVAGTPARLVRELPRPSDAAEGCEFRG